MKKMHKASILVFLLTFITSLTFAQETPEFSVKVGGLIQAWTSYGQINGADTNSLGWGIRRARLIATSNFGTKMKGIVQLELTSFKLLDASRLINCNFYYHSFYSYFSKRHDRTIKKISKSE